MNMFFYYFKLKIMKSNAKFSEFIPGRERKSNATYLRPSRLAVLNLNKNF